MFGFTPPAALEEIPIEGWRATVDGNLLATFLTLKSFLPGMLSAEAGSADLLTNRDGAQVGGSRSPAAPPMAADSVG